MTAILAYLRAHYQFVVMLLAIAGVFLGVKFTVQTAPVPQPEVIIVIPDGDPAAPQVFGAGKSYHPMLRPLLRAKLAIALAERDHLSLKDAFGKVMSVDREKFDTAVATSVQSMPQIAGQLGDGTLLAKIIEFLNSPEGQALIRMLLMLLFAI